MATARAYSGAVTFEGNVYVVGGENQSGPVTTNERYAPANEGGQPWTPLAPLPKARSRFGAGGIANFVFVLGGTPDDGPLAYDVRADSWQSSEKPDIALGSQPAVAARDTSLFVVSGSDKGATSGVRELRQQYRVTVPVN
jgi:hypothetical protein